MGKTASLFLSHGAPNRILKAHPANDFLQNLATTELLTKAKAIVIMSPHWITKQLSISATGTLSSINDFGGFEPELYQQEYQAEQPQWLTDSVSDVLAKGKIDFSVVKQGLDHGAWTVLKLTNPNGQLPVLAMSLPVLTGFNPGEDMSAYVQLGKKLSPLAEQGIIFIGSGSATHNLSRLSLTGKTSSWAVEFSHWLQQQVAENNLAALANAYQLNPHMQMAHPRPDHYLPLLVAAGIHASKKNMQSKLLHDSYEYANLNNSSFIFS
ncbi:Na+/H+ antiporter NhaA [Catenovulum agarivorans DS-2]|uniref:Na+/H+ antiporter NhaA n=1 Tax=Catenovulum agarivorans DS-2 TaxID=1328313 RepID=W7QBA6_9ALTE|nr:class III extradiol ring-cleavage dioxygenase [Catenovulum agarivorans]EWH09276.1 Na+/H+ antiporter NhaA [Catenovulum agarivorans DS-2]